MHTDDETTVMKPELQCCSCVCTKDHVNVYVL